MWNKEGIYFAVKRKEEILFMKGYNELFYYLEKGYKPIAFAGTLLKLFEEMEDEILD